MKFFCHALLLLLCAAQGCLAQTLEEAWAEAYRFNPELQAQRAALRALDEQVAEALSHYRPTIEGNASAGRTNQKFGDSQLFGLRDYAGKTYTYGIQVTQPLFRGLRTLAEVEAAEKQVLAGRARLQAAEQQLLSDTAKAFLETLRDQEILRYARENESVLQEKLKEVRVRHQYGDLTKTDIRQSEARLVRARANSFQAENTLAQDEAAFEKLVGHKPSHLAPPALALSLPATLEEMVTKSRSNPEAVAAEYDAQNARATVKENEGNLLPEVNLVGSSSRSYGQSATLPGKQENSQLVVQATLPLYRSGADYARIREAKETLTQKQMQAQDSANKAAQTARASWQGYHTALATFKADQEGIEAARQALHGVKVEANAGTRTTLDVLNAQQELLDAQIDYSRSRYDTVLTAVQMKAAIGELNLDYLRLPVAKYDPVQHYREARGKWIGLGGEDPARYVVPPELREKQ